MLAIVTFGLSLVMLLIEYPLRRDYARNIRNGDMRRYHRSGFSSRILANFVQQLHHADGLHLACNLITFVSLRKLESIYGSWLYLGLIMGILVVCAILDESYLQLKNRDNAALRLGLGFSSITCALEVLACYHIPVGYFFGSPQLRAYDLVGKLLIVHLAFENACLVGHVIGIGVGLILLKYTI